MDELELPQCLRVEGTVARPLLRQGRTLHEGRHKEITILPDSGAQMNLANIQLV